MEHFVLSRFWTRIWAAVIDIVLLSIAGGIILWFAMPFFVKIGGWGRLLGWPIALAYFGIGNSALAGGQTIGKRLLRIEVVAITGAPVSLSVSLKRAVVFTGPYFLIGVPFFIDFPVVSGIFQWSLGTLNFGILIYFIFNRETRQSLHDLAAATYVVEVMRQEYEPVVLRPRTKKPFNIWMGTSVVLLLLFLGMGVFLKEQPTLKNLTLVTERIGGVKGVRSISKVSYETTSYVSTENPGGKISFYLIGVEAQIPLYNAAFEAERQALFRQLAAAFLGTRFQKDPNESLTIVLLNNADIGIAKNTESTVVSHTIGEWQTLLGK